MRSIAMLLLMLTVGLVILAIDAYPLVASLFTMFSAGLVFGLAMFVWLANREMSYD